MPEFNTLVPDIYNLFNRGHIFDPENLGQFSHTIEEVLETRLKGYLEPRKANLWLSNVGKPLRQLWFQLKSGLPGEQLRANSKLKFLYGDLCEAIVIALAIEAGHKVTDQQKRVEIDGVSGRIDGLIDGVLVDVKSASSRAFVKFKSGELFHDDPFGYVGQLKGYKQALGNIPTAWLAIDKEQGNLCTLELPDDNEYDINEKIVKAREVLAKDVPPAEYCYDDVPEGKSGNEKLSTECSYCDFKFHCKPHIRTFLYSGRPVFLTKVVREPSVFEIKR